MVNPLWLEKAYIIENKATDYDNEDEVDAFSVKNTDISAIRYKAFVGSNPSKTTYFQPVLDALDVSFSPLISASEAIIVEGKNDYYPFVYFMKKIGGSHVPQIFPGNGAGNSSSLISLFRGWGVNFRVVLDADKAGKQAKKKYMDEYFLSDSEVLTLADFSPELDGLEFENIYKDDVRTAVSSTFGVPKLTKRHFSLYFQQQVVADDDIDLKDTLSSFQPIFDRISNEFKS